ncbi:MAG TPA: heavy-metal-associated domain-containing protein [Flavobacterium sp.]|mgnify:CR=1 FL=1|jgi:copper chaperone CopZ|uniref:Heavy-metal-associated domain-containing protein n=1 Tax=Flavobacterium lacisediminis TaxID=2989705 RepID=A0ABT3EID9_9FLAO|nr:MULTISPECIES: heavy-metal-associated domain-containing protein [Flavobacterium]MCW1148330.1 heavy-metal-associated domain-containing protein [Flavobacterium lacisediminis]HLO72718.1 heavy-metal-associated domain-containing protein [Flavobacterium sp.]
MKKINIGYVLVASMVLMFSMKSNAQISKAEIRATGLTCSMCSNAINKQLKSLPEVVNVETDLNTNTFTITLKEGNELSPKVFKEKVEKAGFFIGSLVVTAKPETIAKNSYILVNDRPNNVTEIQFQVVDKGYVTEKEYKKLSKSYKNVETYASNNEDDFHIKILN